MTEDRSDFDETMMAIFSRPMWFDRQGRPIRPSEQSRLKWETPGYHRIGLRRIRRWEVSTVWIGHDLSLYGDPPIIFETMVFPRRGRRIEDFCMRYATEKAAQRGHSEICRMIHSGWRGYSYDGL